MKLSILNKCFYTFQGEGIASLDKSFQKLDDEMKSPSVLKGVCPRPDLITCLATKAVETLIREYDNQKTGILTVTEFGNYHTAKEYSERIRNGKTGPALYSVSGPNMVASIPAIAFDCQGPTLSVLGNASSFELALIQVENYLLRGDAEKMIFGTVEVDECSTYGYAVFFLFEKAREHSNKSVNFLEEKWMGATLSDKAMQLFNS